MKAANSRTDLILKAAAAILTIALCVVVAGTLEPKVVEKGDTAPKFTVATDQGRTISRSDFGGKVLYKEANARDWMDPAFLNYFQSLL